MIKVFNENIGMQNENVFKIMEVIDTDKFRKLVSGFEEFTLGNDICTAVNDEVGNALVCEVSDSSKKLVVKINNKKITIKDEIVDGVSDNPQDINYNQVNKIKLFIEEECDLYWIDSEKDALPK